MTVAWIYGARVEAIRRKRAAEPFDRISMDRLGCINRDLPRREIKTFRGFGTETAHAQIERKIRHAGDLAAILMDSLQPDHWALHECGGRHQRATGTHVERLERARSQTHIVIERNPTDKGGGLGSTKAQADHFEVLQQVLVSDHYALRIGGGAGRILQERDSLASDGRQLRGIRTERMMGHRVDSDPFV